MKGNRIIVVGATGKVGREMLSILLENGVSASSITVAASSRSKGASLQYGSDNLLVCDICEVDFSNHDIALFSAGSDVSKEFAPIAAEKGCVVIDNTSYFRMHDDISLIVPEINFSDLNGAANRNIIANPNCSTIQMVLVLKPLHDLFQIKEIVISTYQSVSGAGQNGAQELLSQTQEIMEGAPVSKNYFKKQIAFNVIPQIDSFTDSLYTKEELKMINETRKILSLDPSVEITATCVRVPVLVGHAVSVYVKFHKEVSLDAARDAINGYDGVVLIDNPDEYEYATPIDSEFDDRVLVSRLRQHPENKYALSFWCVANNLRKGAALNAIQIAKKL